MHILMIANPAAGRGLAEQRIRWFAEILERRGHAVEAFLTSQPGDAEARARLAGPDVERLVVAGGDGTINEVINGLEDPSRIPILHFPTGTANMLAKDLGLPSGIGTLADILETGVVKKADMGLVNGRRFLLLVTAGFDAAVTAEIVTSRRERLGYRGYVVPILKVLARYRPVNMVTTIDGFHRVRGALVMVLNVRHYGGIFVFAETAELDTGFFEVCVFPAESSLSLIRYGLAGVLRWAWLLRDVRRFQAKHVKIEAAPECAVEVDGDYFGTTPITIEVRPAVVPGIVVP